MLETTDLIGTHWVVMSTAQIVLGLSLAVVFLLGTVKLLLLLLMMLRLHYL